VDAPPDAGAVPHLRDRPGHQVTHGPRGEMVDNQRRGAIITGVVLAGMALAIYLTVILQFMR